MKNSLPARAAAAAAVLFLLGACTRETPAGWQGYLEGEFVHVAAPLAGRVESLAVRRGDRVAAGAPLFVLEHAAEAAALRETEDRLRAAEARLADLRLGARPSELAALEARLEQNRAAAELAQRDLRRQEDLFKSGALPASDLDRARLTHERNLRAVEETAAQLATARLGGRADALAAAAADAAAAGAARERAAWAVAQKSQAAPAAALVHDTLFRPGEFAGAGQPVVSLLPPENLKVRFFVPEADLARLRPGARVQVSVSGRAAPFAATVAYVSPKPEYTPPVLYNRANRAKLVFMAEALFAAGAAPDLNPGQPADVALAAP